MRYIGKMDSLDRILELLPKDKDVKINRSGMGLSVEFDYNWRTDYTKDYDREYIDMYSIASKVYEMGLNFRITDSPNGFRIIISKGKFVKFG